VRIGIVGLGHVGRILYDMFPDAKVYDKYPSDPGHRADLSDCGIIFVSVPAPTRSDGSVDLTEVRDALAHGAADAIRVIRSTVPPGTTARLRQETGLRLVHCPEFIGEWAYRVPAGQGPSSWPFMIVGGPHVDAQPVVEAFAPKLGPYCGYHICDDRVAELVKYMENGWLAAQVSFANEMYDLAEAIGISYWQARELWALDPRISRAHTMVNPADRGFGGKCLPKDLRALARIGDDAGTPLPMVRAILEANAARRRPVPRQDAGLPN